MPASAVTQVGSPPASLDQQVKSRLLAALKFGEVERGDERPHEAEHSGAQRFRRLPQEGRVRDVPTVGLDGRAARGNGKRDKGRNVDRRDLAAQAEQDTADGLLECLAWFIVVAANGDVTSLQRAPVGLVRRLRAIHRRDDDMVGEDAARDVGALLALDNHHRGVGPLGEQFEPVERTRIGNVLPAPLLLSGLAVFPPCPGPELLLAVGLVVATDEADSAAVRIAIEPYATGSPRIQ